MKTGVHLILLGAPGAGKGTQARFLYDKLDAIQVSTGDILRSAVKSQSELGKQAQGYMDRGELVPDTLILDIIRERLKDPDFSPNWQMDGFPRNRAQAEAFDLLLQEIEQSITLVINIEVPLPMLMDRLTLRRTCKFCGEVYNLKFTPPKNIGCCDHCQGELIHRSDDNEKSVLTRLQVYQEQTKPLIEYYQEKDLLINIQGNRGVQEVTQTIIAAIQKKLDHH